MCRRSNPWLNPTSRLRSGDQCHLPLRLFRLWIEGIAQAVAEEGEGYDQDGEQRTGGDGLHPVDLELAQGLIRQVAQVGRGYLHAEAQDTEHDLGVNESSHVEGR